MSAIKSIDMSGYSNNIERVNAVLKAVFGVTVEKLTNATTTIFGNIPVSLRYESGGEGTYYLCVAEDDKSYRKIIDLCCLKSSIVYFVAGNEYASIWGSNSSDYRNAIVKISDDTYISGINEYLLKVNDTSVKLTKLESNGCWPREGDDSYVDGVVLLLFHVSSEKEQNFVSDRCYFVTRAGDKLMPGSEVTVGDETYIILTQGWYVLYSYSSGFNLAVKKE